MVTLAGVSLDASARTLVAINSKHSGLGNRVAFTLSAVSVAEATRRDLYYVWPVGETFGARFSDLWDFSPGFEVSLSELGPDVLALPRGDHRTDAASEALDGAPVLVLQHVWAVPVPSGAARWGERLRRLRPVPEVTERVLALRSSAVGEERYVGVQIRSGRLAHPESVRHSPVTWFVRRMREMEARQPGVRFFLSCDDPAIQCQLLRDFPSAFAFSDKGEYNSLEGLRSAVCDLYVLAGADYLLGPHASSFVKIAAELSGNRVPLETSVTPAVATSQRLGEVLDPLQPWRRGV